MKYRTDQHLNELTDLVNQELAHEWDSLLPYAFDIQGVDENGDYYKDLFGKPIHGMKDVAVWYLKMFQKGESVDPVVSNRFVNTIPSISKVTGVQWAFLVLVSPNSIIPWHIDDTDRLPYHPSSLRNLLLSVRTPSEGTDQLSVTIDDVTINQRTGTAVLFDANIPHKAINKTNDWWIALVMVVDKTYWELND
jgi:quercetin dioxygenase-like cupin family protein